MPLLLFDYTIQAVWSFCNSQLIVTVDRTTRTASGAEEMLLHVAIRSVDMIIRLHLSIGTFNMCTAPTGMLGMTTGVFIIITFRLLFTFCDLNYANIYCLISCCLQTSPSQANAMYYYFYVQYLQLVSHKTAQHLTFSPSVIKFRRKIKPLNLHISKHHKHNPLLWLFLCNISTEELTLGTGVSLIAVTFHGTNWWDFNSFWDKK